MTLQKHFELMLAFARVLFVNGQSTERIVAAAGAVIPTSDRGSGTYGYCTDDATCSVSILNLETATCAAVPDLAVVAASATDGSALSSAVA
jgi:hypothetical protein